jgi:[ribosomal protein S5]-alanine N-acetyltransferase
MSTMELTTPRLLLREFGADDHAAVHAFASDVEVVRHTDWGPNEPQDTTAFLREVAEHVHATPRCVFALAVVDRADDALIGSIQLAVTNSQHRRAEMGFVLARSRWGNGYATEAAAALLRFGFHDLALHKISATCDPANGGSERVLRKIGMRPEGHLRGHLYLRGQWRDRLLFAAVAGEQ